MRPTDLVDTISDILDKHDPLGAVGSGQRRPYLREARSIKLRIDGGAADEDVAADVTAVFRALERPHRAPFDPARVAGAAAEIARVAQKRRGQTGRSTDHGRRSSVAAPGRH